jgi:D-arginine dehydrogenase
VPDCKVDIAIVGAGMAGASLAAELAPHAQVLLIEAEDHPGVHATGRSAAFWVESYGGRSVLPLTKASGPWLAERGFLKPRTALHLARADQLGMLDAFERDCTVAGIALERVDRAAAETLVPGLQPEWAGAVLEPTTCDIDVAALHAHYLSAARKGGALLLARAGLVDARRSAGGWQLGLADGRTCTATLLVNAGGAWADEVALRAGVQPLGIQPLRRTMVQLRMAEPVPHDLPLVLGIDGSFYFKPEADRLWLTPHDEHPSPPCDAAPDEIDVAIALDRLEQAVDWQVAAVERRWAGLRSFAPDRAPVYGPDPREPSFLWFAGQGGFGIQTAPAAARLMAQQVLGLFADDMTSGIDPQAFHPARFF